MSELGPLPEPLKAYEWQHHMFTGDQMQAERLRCYELGMARERSKWAKLADFYASTHQAVFDEFSDQSDKGAAEVCRILADAIRGGK